MHCLWELRGGLSVRVPELYEDRKIMMKCDMCYDRSSVGKKPMCATVCPSQALFSGPASRSNN
jgi:Fe-S-cluster-containing dehydrogenase component